jgi:hypothetical protein
MLSKQQAEDGYQVSVVSLDELVPQGHLVRKIENVVYFSFIYDLVKDRYSPDQGEDTPRTQSLFRIPKISVDLGTIVNQRKTVSELLETLHHLIRIRMNCCERGNA